MFINQAHQQGMEFLRASDLDRALSLLNQALEQDPNHPDILSDRGVIFIHLKNKDAALADFDLSLELQPEYGYRYSSRAYCKEFFGDLDGAILDYEQAVLLDKEDAIAYNNLGLLLEKKGRLEQAKRNFDRADHLAKLEENLMHVVDELEVKGTDEEQKVAEMKDRETIPPIEIKEKQATTLSEMKKIFTSKDQFNAFMKFIKNGFKNK
jgi:Tfp pilus assembly protein PilF